MIGSRRLEKYASPLRGGNALGMMTMHDQLRPLTGALGSPPSLLAAVCVEPATPLPGFEYAASRFERRHRASPLPAARETQIVWMAIDATPTSGPIEKLTR
jgi:hypothetical protein